jgi:RHS repeat-associated protein
VTDRIEYSPYATTTFRSGTNDTPFLFNGRYGVMTDPNGLLFMRARYYNAYLCRFVNADPSGFGGGLNHYAYADGNPVSMIDPFGLGADEAGGFWSWLGGAAVNSYARTLDPSGTLTSVLAAWGLTDKYGMSGYAQENGAWNTSVMIAGEFLGTTPFAEGWYGTDIGYGTSLSAWDSGTRLVVGGASMVGTVFAGAGIAHGFTAAPPSLASQLEQLGGGVPRSVPTPKGASQFIFPNGTIIRFDLQPGQFLEGQGPHINLQFVPGWPEQNIHIPVKP